MQELLVSGVAALVGLAIFLLLYVTNPTRVLNGFVFDIELCLVAILLFFALQYTPLAWLGMVLFLLIVMLALFLCIAGIWLVIAFLLINALQVLRRERHSLQNMLSLLIGIGMILEIIFFAFFSSHLRSPVFSALIGWVIILQCWLAVTAISFITTSWLCRILPPRLSTDYIILLGCGLIHGSEVSPLLAGRIERGLRFYRRAKSRGFSPKLICSGGQGPGETRPEACAMREYALAHGAAPEDVLIEDKSTNTLENLTFSRQIADAQAAGSAWSCCFVTSEYHVLRARILARKAGLRKARGLGSRTARYYVTNAAIREYVAVMLTNRLSNSLLLGFLTLAYFALILLEIFW